MKGVQRREPETKKSEGNETEQTGEPGADVDNDKSGNRFRDE